MNKIELLLHELQISYDQEDWFPPLKAALEGVTVEQANWRPEGHEANTIMEIVNHLIYYKQRLLVQLRGDEPEYIARDNNETFTKNFDTDSWEDSLSKLESIQKGLITYLQSKSDDDFDKPLKKHPLGTVLTSIILHDVYHTGQIVQIRKLQGSWPESRA